MASASGDLSPTHLLLLLLLPLLLTASMSTRLTISHAASEPMVAMKPASGPKPVLFDEMLRQRRRRLNSFRICALCTCCGGPKGLCLPSPCCYAINCNIPNRPFGYCSFTPKTCNCFGCHL